jgi:hypothetical protein
VEQVARALRTPDLSCTARRTRAAPPIIRASLVCRSRARLDGTRTRGSFDRSGCGSAGTDTRGALAVHHVR